MTTSLPAERCVIVFSGFLDHIGRLVHPDARSSDTDHARHRTFLITRLMLFVAAILMWLASLIAGHVPAAWEAMAIGWATVPLFAAVHVSRTGGLERAEAACLAAWWGLAITTTLGGGTSLFGGCVLLLVVPLEATFSGRSRLVNVAVAAASIGVVALIVGQGLGVLHAPLTGMPVGDAVVAVPSLLFVVVLARASLALQRHRQRLVAIGEERYRVLAEAIGDLVMRNDRSGNVLMASREAENLFGIKARDLLGRGFFERVHVADRPAFLTLFADAADGDANVSARLRFRTSRTCGDADFSDHPVFAWVEVRARRLDLEARGATSQKRDRTDGGIVAIVRDVTGQIEHEQAMETAKDEAERVSVWKDGFLANVSHELRTPLNAIIGFSEMLASSDLTPREPEKQREYARIITESGAHLLAVVNSLLDISKIEAGRFDLDPESFAVGALIASCCEMVGLKAQQSGITLHRDVEPLVGDIVGDKRACKQILINLLSNALKFTPAGGDVSITARLDGRMVVIVVSDTGVGIAARDLGRLGDTFFQAKSGFDRDYEGTGLGLSVVRGLVGLHGGRIAIASAPAEGTQVTIRLPTDCRTAATTASAKIETISRYRPNPELDPVIKVNKVA